MAHGHNGQLGAPVQKAVMEEKKSEIGHVRTHIPLTWEDSVKAIPRT